MHITEVTVLDFTVQWQAHVVYASITSLNILKHFHQPQINPVPIKQLLPIPFTPPPPLSAVWICIFLCVYPAWGLLCFWEFEWICITKLFFALISSHIFPTLSSISFSSGNLVTYMYIKLTLSLRFCMAFPYCPCPLTFSVLVWIISTNLAWTLLVLYFVGLSISPLKEFFIFDTTLKKQL